MTSPRDKAIGILYITCPQRKNRPMVHISICERCRHWNRCENYMKYLEEVKK